MNRPKDVSVVAASAPPPAPSLPPYLPPPPVNETEITTLKNDAEQQEEESIIGGQQQLRRDDGKHRYSSRLRFLIMEIGAPASSASAFPREEASHPGAARTSCSESGPGGAGAVIFPILAQTALRITMRFSHLRRE